MSHKVDVMPSSYSLFTAFAEFAQKVDSARTRPEYVAGASATWELRSSPIASRATIFSRRPPCAQIFSRLDGDFVKESAICMIQTAARSTSLWSEYCKMLLRIATASDTRPTESDGICRQMLAAVETATLCTPVGKKSKYASTAMSAPARKQALGCSADT
eukprot:scaffold1942_cov351-Prasinococcus_capsulatus_cf.AAC.3